VREQFVQGFVDFGCFFGRRGGLIFGCFEEQVPLVVYLFLVLGQFDFYAWLLFHQFNRNLVQVFNLDLNKRLLNAILLLKRKHRAGD
jgi:hypothetical protein